MTTDDVLYREAARPSDPEARDRGVHPGRQVLAAGSVHAKGAMPLPCDLHLDRDETITLRDGVTLRADVWRPALTGTFPTVLAYTPYGKAGGYWGLDIFPFRAGVPRSAVSGLQSFESPDPAYWCAHGYAVVVVDARGSYHSEGDMRWWGTQGAEDGYDVVEWVAAQPWSTGKVAMTGNSQLAIIQWFIAAARPPHLSAIAPWEGLTDMYRDNLARGGIPFPGFNEDVLNHQYGEHRIEDIPAMIEREPLLDSVHWADKRARVEEIDVPAYVVASYTNPLHAAGTLEAFRRLPATTPAWLRIHNTMEWPDYYEPGNVEDLRRFFDHALRDVDNGWETTPRVRASIIDLGGDDEVDVPLEAWPSPDAVPETWHLDAGTGALLDTVPGTDATVEHRADGAGRSTFEIRLDHELVTAGPGAVRLWVEAVGSDDLDVFVLVEKLSRRRRARYRILMPPPVAALGRVMHTAYRLGRLKYGFIFYRGPEGRLRASHRALDPEGSTELEPVPLHTQVEKLTPGEVVPLDIALSPAMLRWRPGETLRLTVADHDPRGHWFPEVPPVTTINRGTHRIHTGPGHDSTLRFAVRPTPTGSITAEGSR